jgi:hypothetical protein
MRRPVGRWLAGVGPRRWNLTAGAAGAWLTLSHAWPSMGWPDPTNPTGDSEPPGRCHNRPWWVRSCVPTNGPTTSRVKPDLRWQRTRAAVGRPDIPGGDQGLPVPSPRTMQPVSVATLLGLDAQGWSGLRSMLSGSAPFSEGCGHSAGINDPEARLGHNRTRVRIITAINTNWPAHRSHR